MAHDTGLLSTLLARLDADPKAKPFEAYVLAAFEGAGPLANLLEARHLPRVRTARRPGLPNLAAPT